MKNCLPNALKLTRFHSLFLFLNVCVSIPVLKKEGNKNHISKNTRQHLLSIKTIRILAATKPSLRSSKVNESMRDYKTKLRTSFFFSLPAWWQALWTNRLFDPGPPAASLSLSDEAKMISAFQTPVTCFLPHPHLLSEISSASSPQPPRKIPSCMTIEWEDQHKNWNFLVQ